MPHRNYSYFVAVFCLSCSGLSASFLQAKEPVKPAPRGVVIVVGGVGGIDVAGFSAQLVLPHMGVKHEVIDFYWSHGKGQIIKDLQDTRHAMQKADELAWLIWYLKLFGPDRPIYLMGKSGGTGLALAAVEQLPPGMVERVILLSSAVSPTYDLRPALRATKKEIVNFYSPHDSFVLGWGTRKYGTIDGVHGPSAGLNGFQIPGNLSVSDRSLYDRLVQQPWHPGLIWEGHFGGHMGTSLPAFIAKEVAPWLKP